MKTNKMNAIIAKSYGGPEVLEFTTTNIPKLGNDEILVKVVASSATTADTMMRSGKPYFARLFLGLRKPKNAIPGTGFAGVIEEIGSLVSTFKKGDKVFGETTFGFSSNAQYLVVNKKGVVLPLPETLKFHEAANFCDGHLTSYNFLYRLAQIKPGQSILINGASGALGTAAIQIAKYFNAQVTAVCSTKNIGLVKSLGADFVVDYQNEDFTKSSLKYDFIYDTIGKSTFSKSKNILKPSGKFLSPVLKFNLLLQMICTSLFGDKKAIFEATGTLSESELRNLLSNVLNIHNQGKLKTVIDRQFPLEKLAEAHQYIETGHKRGNIVILNN